MNWKQSIAAATLALSFAPGIALADSSISGVENARAKERQGAYLTREDRDNLRRYGGNDDYGYRGYGGYGHGPYVYPGAYDDDGDYGYGYGYGPSVGIYIGN